jgi:glucuronate isomerase
MFLNDDFLLKDEWAKKLYHGYAEKMPIIDYHCHLDPKEIYENEQFKNITAAWLGGDHYKWRLMRACGVPEEKITGNASDYEKFLAWCETVPKIIGNPLYTWSHLELKRFFGIDLQINAENAPEIWEKTNAKLATEPFKKRELIKNSQVKVVCTTDDPADDLSYHQLLAQEEPDFKVLPSFRPDKALNIDKAGFKEWLDLLSKAANQPVSSYEQLISALEQRVVFFHQTGGRLSDHALDILRYEEADEAQLEEIFQKQSLDSL